MVKSFIHGVGWIMVLWAAALQAAPRAFTVWDLLEARDRQSQNSLWPGFDGRAVPLLYFDGRNSYLINHPSPPAEFVAEPGRADVRIYAGRHEAANANTSYELGGVVTAIVCHDLAARTGAEEWAAIAQHESFHVFESQKHQNWYANEMDAFTYPFTDSAAVALRRLESAALRNALADSTEQGCAAWLATMQEQRRARFALIGESSAQFERHLELTEGMAHYVEWRAYPESTGELLPDTIDAVNRVRVRTYAVGRAMGILLDRCLPAWKNRLEAEPDLFLDALLSEDLSGKSIRPAEFDPAIVADARLKANADCRAYLQELARQREEFQNAEGWKVVINCPADNLLWPARFDPMNMSMLGEGCLLHTRMLKLENGSVTVDILDHAALTTGAGAHPIMQGVKNVVISGIANAPVISEANGRATITFEGGTATVPVNRMKQEGRTITVEL